MRDRLLLSIRPFKAYLVPSWGILSTVQSECPCQLSARIILSDPEHDDTHELPIALLLSVFEHDLFAALSQRFFLSPAQYVSANTVSTLQFLSR
jgi:hypothetical protein